MARKEAASTTFGLSPDELIPALHEEFRACRVTLENDRRRLLEQFAIVDIARQLVGVGSVGTRAFTVLLEGRDAHNPLFLQSRRRRPQCLKVIWSI